MAKIFLGTIFLALLAYSQAVPMEDLRLDSKGPSKIVGGGPAAEGEVQFIASMQWYEDHYCGCAWVDKYHCLTACHCVYGYDAKDPDTIAWGNNDMTNFSSFAQCDKFFPHPEYNPYTMHMDLALVRIADRNGDYHPIDLCESSVYTNQVSGQACKAAGWGTLNWGASDLPDELQVVDLYSVDQQTCNDSYYKHDYPITDSMACAAAPGRDACQGDSGGPLYLYKPDGKPCQIGVTSWGIECAHEDYPGVYGCVTTQKAQSWIGKTLDASYTEKGWEKPKDAQWLQWV